MSGCCWLDEGLCDPQSDAAELVLLKSSTIDTRDVEYFILDVCSCDGDLAGQRQP